VDVQRIVAITDSGDQGLIALTTISNSFLDETPKVHLVDGHMFPRYRVQYRKYYLGEAVTTIFCWPKEVITRGNFLEFCLWPAEAHAQSFVVTRVLV
jgi:hypothetical protein